MHISRSALVALFLGGALLGILIVQGMRVFGPPTDLNLNVNAATGGAMAAPSSPRILPMHLYSPRVHGM